jgi:hypothetical protein
MTHHRKDETSEWEKIAPQWVIADNEKLKEEGFKVQAAARSLIRRLGYDILKAEEEMFSPAKMQILERKLGRHLARYSDYIVRSGRHLYVVDVKAKEFGILIVGGQRHLLFNESIFLHRDYVDTMVPVLVLAVLYPRGLFGPSGMRNKKVYYIMCDSIPKQVRQSFSAAIKVGPEPRNGSRIVFEGKRPNRSTISSTGFSVGCSGRPLTRLSRNTLPLNQSSFGVPL